MKRKKAKYCAQCSYSLNGLEIDGGGAWNIVWCQKVDKFRRKMIKKLVCLK